MNKTIYIDNLQDKQIQRFASNDIKVLTPKEVFAQSLEASDELIVLCELNLDKDDNTVNRTAFYGVKLVQELRRNKFMGKVLFVSFMGRAYFLKNHLKYKIISLEAGHSFLRLPVSPDTLKEKLNSIEALDHLSFRDTYLFATGISGSVQEEIHRLSSLKENYKSEHIKFLELVCDFFNEPKKKLLNEYEALADDFIKALGFIETASKNILEKYEVGGISAIHKPKYAWSILWLDDEIGKKYEEGKTVGIVEYLEKEVGIHVIKATTFEDAEDFYTKDRQTNTIRVVIADYRLHHTNTEGFLLQNSVQGYHFIQHIIKEDDTIALFAYSGLPRRFLMETFSHYGKKIQSFSKKDFPIDKEDSFGYLSDAIVLQGDDAWIEVNNQPNATAWKNMCETYFEFKSGFDFSAWNKQTNADTLKNIELYKQSKTSNLKVTNTLFNKNGKIKERTNRLKDLLIGRRLAIFLLAESYMKGSDMIVSQKDIGNYLHCSSSSKPIKDNTAKSLFHKMALEVTNFPMFLLPEENAWLEFDSGLGFDVKKKIDNYWEKIESIREIIKECFKKSHFLKSLLVNDSLGDVYFNEDFEPIIRSVEDVKRVLKTVYDNISVNENFEANLTDFISLLTNLIAIIEKPSTPKNVKALISYINKLPARTKGKYKELKRKESVIEEYKRLFAPWDFLLPKRNFEESEEDYTYSVNSRIDNYKLACKAFEKIKSKWKIYGIINEAYKEYITEGSKDVDVARNKAIYFGIHNWKDIRNSYIEKRKESSTTDVINRTSDSNIAPVDDFDFSSLEHFEFYNADIDEDLKKRFLVKMKNLGVIPCEPVQVRLQRVSDIQQGAEELIKIAKITDDQTVLAYVPIDMGNYNEQVCAKIDSENLSKNPNYLIVAI